MTASQEKSDHENRKGQQEKEGAKQVGDGLAATMPSGIKHIDADMLILLQRVGRAEQKDQSQTGTTVFRSAR